MEEYSIGNSPTFFCSYYSGGKKSHLLIRSCWFRSCYRRRRGRGEHFMSKPSQPHKKAYGRLKMPVSQTLIWSFILKFFWYWVLSINTDNSKIIFISTLAGCVATKQELKLQYKDSQFNLRRNFMSKLQTYYLV